MLPRIAIIGTGAIGGFYGVMLARGTMAEVIAASGLRALQGEGGQGGQGGDREQ